MEASWLGVVRCRNQAARPAHASYGRTRARARGARCVLVALAGAAIAAVGQVVVNASVWSSFAVISPGPACSGAAAAATRPRLWLRSPQGLRGSSVALAARGGAEDEEDDEYEYVPSISVKTLKVGQELAGIVTKVSNIGATVDFGAEQAGFVPRAKLQDGPTERPQDVVNVGDTVTVWVSEVKDGQVILSMSKLKVGRNFGGSNTDLSVFQGANPDSWVEGKVVKVLPAGCLVEIPTPKGDATATGLVPFAQMKDGDTSKEVDEKVKVRILKVDTVTQRLSLTMKAGVKSFEGISPDTWLEGKVVKILDGVGCIVEVPSPSGDATATGLVLSGQIKDGARVLDVSSEVSVGQQVKVRVLSVDADNQRLSLTMRSPVAGPPAKDVKPFEGANPDTWVEGKVVNVLPGVGCFVDIPTPSGDATVTGLVPMREIKDGERVEDISKEVSVDQQVKVRVMSVDVAAQRLTLSMRAPPAGRLGGGGRPGGPASRDVSAFEGASPDTWVEGKVVKILPGAGCLVEIPTPSGDGTATGLVPISQIKDGERVEDVSKEVAVDQQVKVRVASVDLAAQRLTLSMRPPIAGGAGRGRQGGQATKDVTPFQAITPDVWLQGKVVKIVPAGCLVELPTPAGDATATGLVPLGQIREGGRLEAINGEVTVGEQVKVRIVTVDVENQKLSLSMRVPPGSLKAFEGANPDAWVDGKVVKLLNTGCLVEIPTPTGDGTATGLVVNNQIREGLVEDAGEEVAVGQHVKVRITKVDVGGNRLSLSMRPPPPGKDAKA